MKNIWQIEIIFQELGFKEYHITAEYWESEEPLQRTMRANGFTLQPY